MFKTTIKSENIKRITSALLALVKEAKWNITASGISINAVDSANVAMVNMDIKKEAFENYEVSDGEIGVDLVKLDGLLEMAEKDGIVGLELDEAVRKLSIQMGALRYMISLLDPSTLKKPPKTVNMDLPGIIIMKGEDIKRAIKAGSTVSDHLHIGISGNVCIMGAEGDTDAVKLEKPRDELIELTNNGTKDLKSLYSLEYLNKIGKIVAKTEQVTININQDFPCLIKFDLPDGSGTVSYMIAPRVESS